MSRHQRMRKGRARARRGRTRSSQPAPFGVAPAVAGEEAQRRPATDAQAPQAVLLDGAPQPDEVGEARVLVQGILERARTIEVDDERARGGRVEEQVLRVEVGVRHAGVVEAPHRPARVGERVAAGHSGCASGA